MSSPADSLVTPEPVFDRRFYPRTASSSLTHVIFGPEISARLIDLGENGFRLESPFELSRNFVCRATLPLNGLERPIELCVRVVWAGDANQAGIQFLDLSDEDRVQIRKWAKLQENNVGPAETTEILDGARTQEELFPKTELEQIRAMPAVSDQPRRKNRIGIAIAVGAACVAALTATGLAVWASPLGSWIAKSLAAQTKSVFAMAKSGNPENASASTPLPKIDAKKSEDSANAVTTKNEAMPGADRKKSDLRTANEIVRQKRTTLTDAVKTSASEKHSEQSKSIAKAKANAIKAAGIASEDGLSLSAGAPTRSGDKPDGDVNSGRAEEKLENKPQTRLTGTAVEQPKSASDAAPPALGARADFRPPRQVAAPATSSEAVPGEPNIIQTPDPTSRVVDVILPNSSRPSLVAMPGERTFQSSELGLRIQRAILAPAGHATWSKERKKKVVLGDLLSRVDPQAPRTTAGAGSQVSVRAMLGRDGRVERLMPVNGSAELVPCVMRAVREWRFQPTMLDGKPVETAALVTIEFRGSDAAAATR